LAALLIVTGPTIWVLVLVVSTLLGTVQGEQPGPVTTMMAPEGSKLLPLMVSENEFGLAVTDVGEMLLVAGALTVRVWPLEIGPPNPF
jgi:hypothetical protein